MNPDDHPAPRSNFHGSRDGRAATPNGSNDASASMAGARRGPQAQEPSRRAPSVPRIDLSRLSNEQQPRIAAADTFTGPPAAPTAAGSRAGHGTVPKRNEVLKPRAASGVTVGIGSRAPGPAISAAGPLRASAGASVLAGRSDGRHDAANAGQGAGFRDGLAGAAASRPLPSPAAVVAEGPQGRASPGPGDLLFSSKETDIWSPGGKAIRTGGATVEAEVAGGEEVGTAAAAVVRRVSALENLVKRPGPTPNLVERICALERRADEGGCRAAPGGPLAAAAEAAREERLAALERRVDELIQAMAAGGGLEASRAVGSGDENRMMVLERRMEEFARLTDALPRSVDCYSRLLVSESRIKDLERRLAIAAPQAPMPQHAVADESNIPAPRKEMSARQPPAAGLPVRLGSDQVPYVLASAPTTDSRKAPPPQVGRHDPPFERPRARYVDGSADTAGRLPSSVLGPAGSGRWAAAISGGGGGAGTDYTWAGGRPVQADRLSEFLSSIRGRLSEEPHPAAVAATSH
jgi:hypothetical protein